MIVIRVILRRKDLRDAMGPLVAPNRLYKTIITMLVESCALYAASSLLNIGPWCTNNPVQFAFFPILVQAQVRLIYLFRFLLHHDLGTWLSNLDEEQVIAPLLIILRVANRGALTKDTTASGNLGSLHFGSEGRSTAGTGTLTEGVPVSSTGTYVETRDEFGAGTETTVASRH